MDDTLDEVVSDCCERESCSQCGTHRNVTQASQQDVDEEISIAAALEEDTEGREEDGEDDLDDVAGGALAFAEVLPGTRCPVC